MALMLRKAAHPVLIAADLDPYHADLDRNTKEFKLYTPCGKTFATVSGVLFASLAPTKDDIAYAVELLEFWLQRNKAIIDIYIAAFTKLQMYENLETTRGDMAVFTSMSYSKQLNKRILTAAVCVEHNKLKFSLNAEGLFTKIVWDDAIPLTTSLKLPAKKVAEAISFLDEHLDFIKAKTTVADILVEMNTCNT